MDYMTTISEIVMEIIQGDEIALEALRMDYLNLSAYAIKIMPLVAKETYKKVSKSAIVTALSRMKDELSKTPPLCPVVKIEDMSIKSPLTEISFEKTAQLTQSASKLDSKLVSQSNFFTVTHGVNEITLIFSENLEKQILGYFKIKPKGIYKKLVAITVRFVEQEYIETPNMIYTLVNSMARKRINIMEIVSTFTEISFIVKEKDMDKTIDALKQFLVVEII